jgi:hypothetical protein
LLLGSVAFLVFWMNSVLFDDQFYGYDLPWVLELAIHGCSILFLTIGLGGLMRDANAHGEPLLVIATPAIAIVGLFTILPLFFAGMGVLGLATVARRRVASADLLLILGAVLFLAAWITGARPGFEDAPTLSRWQELLAGSGVTFTAVGCAGSSVSTRTGRTLDR